MLDQMQVTTRVITVSFASTSSYAIGPIDPAHLLIQQAALSDGEEITLLAPASVPPLVLSDPACKGGYDEEELLCDLSVPQFVNQLYYRLKYELHPTRPTIALYLEYKEILFTTRLLYVKRPFRRHA
jgi:hypothetical protein